MRIGYLSSRLLVAINIMGVVLCLWATIWVYITHTELTPEKNERVFQKNIAEANKIRDMEIFRQVHQSLLVAEKREKNQHYENVQPMLWLTSTAILLFIVNGVIFYLLVKSKAIRIR